MTAPVQQTMPVCLDEFGYYCGGQNDTLKEDLRKIDGVPNATYLVKDGQVFVFDNGHVQTGPEEQLYARSGRTECRRLRRGFYCGQRDGAMTSPIFTPRQSAVRRRLI